MEYNLNFMHPQYGTIFNADIDANFTIHEMIDNLVWSGFLPPNEEGYQLALGKIILADTATFLAIEELEDGNVIRIIANELEAKEVVETKTVKLLLQHPKSALVLELEAEEDKPIAMLIEIAIDKNFVAIASEALSLEKQGKPLDLAKTVLDNNLKTGDYIQICNKEEVPLTEILNQKIDSLQEKIQADLALIKDSIPATHLIPIDPTRAVNPTIETYESIDTISNRLRKKSKQKPFQPIKIIPTVVLVWLGIFIVLMVALIALFVMQ